MSDSVTTIAAATGRILLVDDDPMVLSGVVELLKRDGYEVTAVTSAARAKDCLSAGQFDLVVSDLAMPGTDGMDLLRYVRERFAGLAVIMITAHGSIASAVEAVRAGAYDYLTKPILDEQVRAVVRRAVQQHQLLSENTQLHLALKKYCSFDDIVSQDARISKVFELVDAVADTPTTVLITGESGTGKSLISRTIHNRSVRRDRPFVEVPCGALPDTLLESELFGHVRGAFTDAVGDRVGKFAAADGGTIFLDEISGASPALQLKLLRVLQERKFEPVGSNRTAGVDVRVILATNRDLLGEVEAGRFRRDLYYRVNVVNVELPPLRERVGDIPRLAEHFLTRFRRESSRPIRGFTEAALGILGRYHWPGNVRELENTIERAVLLNRTDALEVADFPEKLQGPAPVSVVQENEQATPTLQHIEKAYIHYILSQTDGKKATAARILGIDTSTLYRKLERYDLKDSASPKSPEGESRPRRKQ
ncbi:MAG: sigma-54-dependent Fis family transcriptional regulator [Phycisphaerae bacterium]|nr:sigma-54-dependent Fis family transcriptional regulator [Phycisphaerae bacterium]